MQPQTPEPTAEPSPPPAPASTPQPTSQPTPPPVTTPPLPADTFEPPVSKEAERLQDADTEMLEPGEHIVTIVHRHPIGIIGIYIETLIGVVALTGLTLVLSPDFIDNLSGQSYRIFIALVLMAVVLLSLILFVATYIYRQSRLIVSDKSLIQIIQRGLFVRKISRLSMSNVQDVTAEHDGFLATIFGFGTLTIETAGQEDNFIFPWCPTPDTYAERILQARQKYVQSLDEGEKAAGDGG